MKPISSAALVALFSLFGLHQGQAQTQAGLRAGVNTSKVLGDQVTNPASMGFSYQAGLFVRVNVGGLNLQPELLFTSRKYEFTQVLGVQGATTLSEKKISSTYLDVPVYMNIDLAENLNLLVGPMGTMRMAGKQEFSDNKNSDGHDFELFDIGVSGGLAYVTKSGIDFSARGQLGFLPIFTKVNQNLPGPNDPDIKNMSFQFTVGLPISRSSESEPKPKSYKESY